MREIADEIAAVVAVRRERLPEVQAEIARWRRVDAAIATLQQATAYLDDDPAMPPEVSAQLGHLPIDAARLSITHAIELVQRLEARVARGTLCIGVGGATRTGKSTVLQSISGLTDVQLPTGGDAPATAVPSRLYHTTRRRRALLSLHTFDTFRATHLQPRYVQAGLGEPPTDVDAFRSAEYPEPDPADPTGPFGELRAMQEALWSYEGLLDRPDRVLELTGDELDRLSEYVAYPDPDQSAAGRPARRYLGVRDARIECPFPRAEHGALTLVDLPGLDTGPVEEQRQHLARLRYEVDVMLLLKQAASAGRDTNGSACVDAERAIMAWRGRARPRGSWPHDFVLLVCNTGTRTAPPVDPVRDGQPHHPVLEVNGREPADVSAHLLRPVLRHLVERLPGLDETLYADTRTLTQPVQDELVGLAAEIKAILSQVPAMTQGATEELYQRADRLHARLAVALRRLLADMLAGSVQERVRFRAAVMGIHTELVRWVRDGFGVGRDRWCADALRGMIRDGAGPFATGQWTRIRVEVSDRYAALDRHLHRRLMQVWADLAAALSCELGMLLSDRSGAAALSHLAELARNASEPCLALGSAIEAMLAVRLDYQTHLHPRVWSEVDTQTPVLPEVPASGEGAEQLYQVICLQVERAAARTQERLLREAALPDKVLCAAVARFADTVLARTSAKQEIRQLVRAYHRRLWAAICPELDAADARIARVVRAVDDVLAAATELAEAKPGADGQDHCNEPHGYREGFDSRVAADQPGATR